MLGVMEAVETGRVAVSKTKSETQKRVRDLPKVIQEGGREEGL